MGIVVLRAGAYTLTIMVNRLRIHGCYTKPLAIRLSDYLNIVPL